MCWRRSRKYQDRAQDRSHAGDGAVMTYSVTSPFQQKPTNHLCFSSTSFSSASYQEIKQTIVASADFFFVFNPQETAAVVLFVTYVIIPSISSIPWPYALVAWFCLMVYGCREYVGYLVFCRFTFMTVFHVQWEPCNCYRVQLNVIFLSYSVCCLYVSNVSLWKTFQGFLLPVSQSHSRYMGLDLHALQPST